MMKWNAWWLPFLLGIALSAVYFLPPTGKVAESAVRMELPGSIDNWNFAEQSASKEELGTLPPDTEFAKALCYRPRVTDDGRQVNDLVNLSVVLSGSDLNSSIHRPERCMPAQGHTITDSRSVKLQLDNDRSFDAKRLRSVQSIKKSADKGGETINLNCVTYYFFVGHDRVTNDHFERTVIDMKDRLVRGMDQRWAYVSASMWYGKRNARWLDHDVSENEADQKLRKFLTEFAKIQIDWDQIKR